MNISDAPVLTIDGPAGSGKGTIAALVAQQLGWNLLDSGAIYRMAANAALEQGIDVADSAALVRLIEGLVMRFDGDKVYCNQEDVSAKIRTPLCADVTSKISALPEVRTALLKRQRDFRQVPGLVADGRDMGTVVFPDARLKIFLTASPEERAQRRFKQLSKQGISANLASLVRDIAARDERDSSRAVAPLKPATDAWVIDSSDLSPEQVLAQIVKRFQA